MTCSVSTERKPWIESQNHVMGRFRLRWKPVAVLSTVANALIEALTQFRPITKMGTTGPREMEKGRKRGCGFLGAMSGEGAVGALSRGAAGPINDSTAFCMATASRQWICQSI